MVRIVQCALTKSLNQFSAVLNMPANLENSAVATGLDKVSFPSSPKERQCQRMLKLQHDCTHLTYYQRNAQNSPSQASTVCELCTSTCSDGFRKGRGNRCQIANSCWTIDKGREFQEIIYFCFIDYTKAFDWVDHNKLWKILKKMGKPDPLTCLLRNLYADQEAKLELDMEQQTGSKLGKEYIKAVYCHPAYLTYMQSTSCKMLGWMKHKLKSRLLGEISVTQICR